MSIIDQCLALHRSGRARDAEACYRAVLNDNPHHGDAWHLLGLLYYQQGQQSLAADCVARAIKQNRSIAAFHNTLGEIRRAEGRLEEAKSCYRTALRFKPDYPEAHANLGLVCEALNDLAGAENHFRRAIALVPKFAPPYYNLARVLRERGNDAEALTSIENCLRLAPDAAMVHNEAGLILEKLGKRSEAIDCFRQALTLAPELGEASFNLGAALAAAGQFEASVESLRTALRLEPDYAETYRRLALSLRELGKFEPALLSMDEYLKRKPDDYAAWALKAGICVDAGRAAEGLRCAERALPGLQGDYDLITTYVYLRCQTGDTAGAVAFLAKMSDAHPENAVLASSLLFNQAYRPGRSPEEIFAAHQAWGKRFTARLMPNIRSHTNKTQPDRKLRIGYVSPDFKRHPVGFLLEPVLAHQDRDGFEIICYSDVVRDDALTERFRQHADRWQDIRGKTDEEVAELVRADGVDILVDLAGHTSNNRLLVFARQPAPVQIAWLGYTDTTGMAAMDYLVVDEFSVPFGSPQFFSEKHWRFPHSRFCYGGPVAAPEVAPAPAVARGEITFGSFNNPAKLNEEVIALWSRLLTELPNSRLVLKGKYFGEEETRELFLACFAAQGVARERLELRPSSRHEAMLAEYGDIDIVLDTFPYPGGMTTLEALWMGVPVLTLAGKTLLSRQSASFLRLVGLQDWIAWNAEEFLAKARTFAGDVPALAAIRSGLRLHMQSSPLCDSASFARQLELCYRDVWRAYCAEVWTT